MKKSYYNISYRIDQGIILYNSLTNALVLLDDNSFSNYENGNLTDDNIMFLYNNGFLVDDNVDEQRYVEYRYYKAVFNNSSPFFRVLTTTACNAKCNYCYEKEVSPQIMTKETAAKLVSFIEKETKNSSSFSIRWFGGEPLLNWQIIDYVTERIPADLRGNYKAYITTNGSLWTDELVEKARNSWSINRVQISLDGYGEFHNDIKRYNGIEDGFTRTIENINKLSENDIKVDIRLNCTKSNIESMRQLLYYLDNALTSKENVIIYTYPIFDSNVNKVCYNKNNNLIQKDEYSRCLNPLNQLISKLGFTGDKGEKRQKDVSCGSIRSGNYVIDPEGRIFKCSFELGDPSKSIGSIEKGVSKNSNFLLWCLPKYHTKCLNCKFLPICQGGCKYQVIYNNNTVCRYTDEILLISLKEQIANSRLNSKGDKI